jgi:hypothetical protein
LFGYRTLGQLREAFPDCEVNGDLPAALLEVLFPRAPSNLWLTR